MNAAERAARYLAKLPPAVAGRRGHDAAWLAACRLVEFGLPWAEAWPLLAGWNRRCEPPWSERELHHKLADAYRRTAPRDAFRTQAGGAFPAHRPGLFSGRPVFPAHAENAKTPPAAATSGASAHRPETPAPGPNVAAPPAALSLPRLPELSAGRPEDIAALATLRGLSEAGVTLAARRGLLAFGRWRGRPAWFIRDRSGRLAQARRLDGQPWADGVKAWTLPGSQPKWPAGLPEAAGFPALLLVEGGPDLLAAHHCIAAAGRAADLAAVAMLGAAMPLHPEALPAFRGRRVRLYEHADEAGARACGRWLAALEAAGAAADVCRLRDLPGRPHDLNDLARALPPGAPPPPDLLPT